mmetsp:Transcript_15867/g.47750  ORF Transcript_15867/g.47750 Transcript_15867/m.47750 type:complete len:201 (-) Transcript_15867:1516-2118(-)
MSAAARSSVVDLRVGIGELINVDVCFRFRQWSRYRQIQVCQFSLAYVIQLTLVEWHISCVKIGIDPLIIVAVHVPALIVIIVITDLLLRLRGKEGTDTVIIVACIVLTLIVLTLIILTLIIILGFIPVHSAIIIVRISILNHSRQSQAPDQILLPLVAHTLGVVRLSVDILHVEPVPVALVHLRIAFACSWLAKVVRVVP